MTDEELIAAFQQGDAGAFRTLVGRFKDQLMNFAYRYLGDYDEASDVVQETLIRLYQKKHMYRQSAKFSTWLYTIAVNLANTRLRRKRRLKLFSLKGDGPEIADESRRPDVRADRALREEAVHNALECLSPKYREIVVLFDIQELSYEEISSVTGIRMGTVKSRLNRGRAQMRELLKDLFNE